MADRTHRPKASELTLEEFLAVYPRIAGADPSTDEKKDVGSTETTTETTAEATAETTAEPPAENALGDAGKKALKAERDARKAAEKARDDALARAKQYEDAQKSDAEKLEERATEAEKALAAANRRLAAMEAGLPADAADRLRGDTPEELKADAEALKALLGTPEAQKKNEEGEGATPPGSLDGGARTAAPKKSLDAQIAEATVAQDWERVSRLNTLKLAQLHVA